MTCRLSQLPQIQIDFLCRTGLFFARGGQEVFLGSPLSVGGVGMLVFSVLYL